MKECKANECEGYHEGYCIMGELYKGFNPDDCDVKSNADLMTEEEYDESIKLKSSALGDD